METTHKYAQETLPKLKKIFGPRKKMFRGMYLDSSKHRIIYENPKEKERFF